MASYFDDYGNLVNYDDGAAPWAQTDAAGNPVNPSVYMNRDPTQSPVSADQLAQMTAYARKFGGSDPFQLQVGQQMPTDPTGQGRSLYNWGNGYSSWVDPNNGAWIAAPHHNDGFFQKDAYDARAMLSEMPGLAIPLIALGVGGIAGALGGGAAAGGDAALAGGGEVGSGYAASAPGWAGAGEGAAAGGGAVAGESGAGSVAGGAGSDTLAGSGGTDLGGGLSVDEFGNVTGGSFQGGSGTAGAGDFFNPSSGGSIFDMFKNPDGSIDWGKIASTAYSNKGLIGSALGALIGSKAANPKPAGTTTTTQDLPQWLLDYAQGNLSSAQAVRDRLALGNGLMTAAVPQYLKTINGDYLNPSTNPYLDATYKHAAGLVGADVDSRFEAAGRYGSGAHQGVLQEGLNNLATSIYGGNYQAERARQNSAVTGTPNFDIGSAAAAFSPYSGFSDLFPNSRAMTSPYFSNTWGGILGGALAGSQLSKMYA